MRGLRFGGRDVVRRDEAGGEPGAHVADVRVHRLERAAQHGLGLAGRHRGPVGARDLEPEVGPRRVHVLAIGASFRARRALERIAAAAGVDRPLQVEPRAVVVGNVGIDDLRRPPGTQ